LSQPGISSSLTVFVVGFGMWTLYLPFS